MDIHAPEGPTHSFRDFAIHIGIVTIGILIALGLEGVRETLHEREQRRETRAVFRREIDANRKNLGLQDRQLDRNVAQLDSILSRSRTPSDAAVLKQQIAAVDPGFYFVSDSGWQTALSTGALGHMETDEVLDLAGIAVTEQHYSEYEQQTYASWANLQAYFQVRSAWTQADIDTGLEKAAVLRTHLVTMRHLAGELAESMKSMDAVR
jgi:hypothetical protein